MNSLSLIIRKVLTQTALNSELTILSSVITLFNKTPSPPLWIELKIIRRELHEKRDFSIE